MSELTEALAVTRLYGIDPSALAEIVLATPARRSPEPLIPAGEATTADPRWSDEDIFRDVDPGIRSAVRALREAGVETFESCQGGPGHPENPDGMHAYPEPTVRFYGDSGAGWHALSVLLSLDFPVGDLRRTWPIVRGVPTGPCWEVTFTRRLDTVTPSAADDAGRP